MKATGKGKPSKTASPAPKKSTPKSTKDWKVLDEAEVKKKGIQGILKDALESRRRAARERRKQKPAVNPKRTRNRTAIRRIASAKTKLAPPEAKQQLSNEERVHIIARRAVYLHGFECMPYRLIAVKLKEEFQLEYTPPIGTICTWMNIGKAEFLEDINEMRTQLRLQQFQECEEMKARWFDAANRDILIKRTQMQDGEPVEIIDENAFKEQAKAAEVYLKLMERQAKLIGMDLVKEPEAGKTGNLQEVYLWISNQINYANPSDPKQAEAREVGLERFGSLELVLDSGSEDEL